jgi:predicted nucleotidyltransferase
METHKPAQIGRTPHPCVVELREMLQTVLGDNFLRLYHYGSRVEGGAEADSDYDVLCVTKFPLSKTLKEELLDRRLDIELANDVLLDLHFYSEEQLRTPPVSFTPYVRHVTNDGIIV